MGFQRISVMHGMLLWLCFMTRRGYATHEVARPSRVPSNVFRVDDFGAKGDGRDDSQAFMKAWEKACSTAFSTFVVPENKNYLLGSLTFSGPCKSYIVVKVYGTIKASPNRADYKQDTRHWLMFKNVTNLQVEGGGTVNGNGKIWWQNSCKINKSLPCKHAPTALTFNQCNNLIVRNIRIQDAQQMHLIFQECNNVQALNLRVIAPGTSPNTDGIHVTETKNILIANSFIGTGDDCISVVDGSRNVQARNITCGPGHGISIGSLGADGSEDYVSDVIVDNAKLSGTTNGVRIKTWQGGSGRAERMVFRNIIMNNVKNPIIIDQNYCDKKARPCPKQKSAVQISDILYMNIKGTSETDEAIKLGCSKSHPCQGIRLQNVNIVKRNRRSAKALCENVKITALGKVLPSCRRK